MKEITAIMTGYNRPYTLKKQYDAIKNQTVAPVDILLWHNKGTAPESPPYSDLITDNSAQLSFNNFLVDGVKGAFCNHNFKFHGRFAFALLAQTEYVAIFDDDTIPGEKWFENCLNTMDNREGILGTTGIKLQGDFYDPHIKVGFNAFQSGKQPNYIAEEVDLVGHCWFVKREWLQYMWYEYPVCWDNGEDIQFSYLCQKYGGIKTFVPPHPANHKELWGSIEPNIGQDKKASWRKTNHMPLRNMIVQECIKNGWKPVFKK